MVAWECAKKFFKLLNWKMKIFMMSCKNKTEFAAKLGDELINISL